ncbi:hydantoinase/oxoprolinase family protein [Solidesulfovibrio magneticus]|uniref:Hydantoin utilization protein A n=1 Tax=Solidesulfovibrio magneticus (strain ATCC 700980 / DSM 13731 / RS-1) TaxID=573370 RepID=C4XH07_SOLM1|nr:hydantoinase/oxoprolinase family protein [Solidesulfovibrio magneticus]BAH76312.1 hydantoin utilization protein A [Solidesulfovibrio magneticus RS-1]
MAVVGVDTGGTFTDVICWTDDGFAVVKLPSSPDNPARAVLSGLARLAVPARRVMHGSTVATNALLERRGAVTAFVTNQGFEDIIAIGRQNRPELYDLASRKEPCLVPEALRFGAPGRVSAEGKVIEELSAEAVRELTARVAASGAESVAVCLLFSFLKPEHELLLGEALAEAGLSVSLSSDILAEFREYERAATTVANAYVAPVMAGYLGDLAAGLPEGAELCVMQSSGGLIRAETARREPVRTVLSGPAGGVVAGLAMGKAAGFDRLITFDMGGTSTDVSLLDGALSMAAETELAGLPIKTPMLDIHTVGAGGGSLARLDAGGALVVGPESAGAVPGPACYGKGDGLTVTDANLFLGRLSPDHFLGGQMPLFPDRLPELFTALGAAGGLTAVEAAEGVVAVAEAAMERAIRVISVERGHDPADFALLSYGGAGGLHAVSLARLLGVKTVVVPRHPGLFSALGMLFADIVRDFSETVMAASDKTDLIEVAGLFGNLETRARQVMAEEAPGARMVLERQLDMRYQGQSHELPIRFVADPFLAFHNRHEAVFGFKHPKAVIEIVTLRIRARVITDKPQFTEAERLVAGVPAEAMLGWKPLVWQGAEQAAMWYDRDKLLPGNTLSGPALVAETSATTFLPPGVAAEVDGFGNLVISVDGGRAATA